ncbi:MAG: SDR family oxidoreductase [Phycisphaerales bacterium]|nr:SDR family oxidoreductase [Phycisphaerales bacterium]
MATRTENAAPVAIITGAGSGIGRATALCLWTLGYSLVLVGRDRAKLDSTVRALPAPAPGHENAAQTGTLTLAIDIGAPESGVQMVRAAVDRFGRLDALINNAGVAPLASIDHSTPELVEQVFRTNSLAPAAAIAAAWPVFTRQRSGCVVNVSTMATRDPFPGFFAYAASKASVNLMARSCANEGKAIGVRAFAVAPGAVETPLLRSLFPESSLPASACLSPDSVAAVIVACIRGERDDENGETIYLQRE